jgi:hypothetical protein
MKNTKQTVTLKANQAAGFRAELARKIASIIGKEENRITEISGLSLRREYSRFFGQPPMRDIRALLSPCAPKLELVGSL